MNEHQSNLYQQTIIEHNRNPQNFRRIEKSSHSSEGYNPICGDQITIYLAVSDGKILDASFDGDCCAVCKASASILTTEIKNITHEDFYKMREYFLELINHRVDSSDQSTGFENLDIFRGIWNYSSRIHCANLPWQTCYNALNDISTSTTENI